MKQLRCYIEISALIGILPNLDSCAPGDPVQTGSVPAAVIPDAPQHHKRNIVEGLRHALLALTEAFTSFPLC